MRPFAGDVVLDALAQAAGTEWAAQEVTTLIDAGRAVVGGWPGTLSEARARVDARLATQGAPGLSVGAPARESLARRAYDAARGAWAARAQREPQF